jgi:hypothetical protein
MQNIKDLVEHGREFFFYIPPVLVDWQNTTSQSVPYTNGIVIQWHFLKCLQ